ncbi:GAF domain-containing sensor histidine kinase [Streptosporangium sp. NPDC048047]|uniref:GAF domain-containing sensor histidine kinase n=1 Tax=Streptosporangium sp. NPDC048047 TaxID=3155748 RepID=UPI0034262B70
MLAGVRSPPSRTKSPSWASGLVVGLSCVAAATAGFAAGRVHRRAAAKSADANEGGAADCRRASCEELRHIAVEQAALRRVATLVAHGISSRELFSAVAGEMGRIVGAEHVMVNRYEPNGMLTVVGLWNGGAEGDGSADAGRRAPDDLSADHDPIHRGTRLPIRKGTTSELVLRTRRPGRVTDFRRVDDRYRWIRGRMIGSTVGAPITVQGRLWGVMLSVSTAAEPQPPETEARMMDFTELMAIAIANAENLAEISASRARIVAAADETRRRIERDLHDGIQQLLVRLALELQAAVAVVPHGREEMKARLFRVIDGLADALEDLREISRGLHPAVLSEAGLGPALRTLARRSDPPVELDVGVEGRLNDSVEAAAYYVVSEALTNVTKHAHASRVRVGLHQVGATVRVSVVDDGVGGADPGLGSGLTGLRDRVEALGGGMSLRSPEGGGTTLVAEIPLRPVGAPPES